MALIDEWIEKAEADYKGASVLNRQRSAPLPDLVCYHYQQSAENSAQKTRPINSGAAAGCIIILLLHRVGTLSDFLQQ